MASPAAPTTHQWGPVPVSWYPAAIRTRVMTPMVFWPSEVPWARATMEAEIRCPLRKIVWLKRSVGRAMR